MNFNSSSAPPQAPTGVAPSDGGRSVGQGPNASRRASNENSATAAALGGPGNGLPMSDAGTAVLDACILDLSRRRLEMAREGALIGGLGGPTGLGSSLGSQGLPGHRTSLLGGYDPSFSGLGGPGGMSHPDGLGMNTARGSGMNARGSLGMGRNPNSAAAATLAARQKQIQMQQAQLERAKKELELNQQLLAGYAPLPGGCGGGNGDGDRTTQAPMVDTRASAHSQGSGSGQGPYNGPHHFTNAPPPPGPSQQQNQQRSQQQPPHPSSQSVGGGAGRGTTPPASRKWWVCQFCQTKAFASRDEAREHESGCPEGQGRRNQQHSCSYSQGRGSGMQGDWNQQQQLGPYNQQANCQQIGGGSSGYNGPYEPNGSYGGDGYDNRGMQGNHDHSMGPNNMQHGMNMGSGTGSQQMQQVQQGQYQLDHSTQQHSRAMIPGQSYTGQQQGGYHRGYSEQQGSSDNEAMPSPSGTDSNSGNVGPCTILPNPLPLSMNSDKDWLTPLHCFVRRHCVEVFCATAQDVATPSKGKRKPIQVGQVGIRCPHCHPVGQAPHHNQQIACHRERGSVYYPTTIASIYNATMNLLQRHLHSCSAVPEDIMKRYGELKADDARSGTSKKYWVDSAKSLGLIDTPSGIRFSALRPPPLPALSRHQDITGVKSANRRNSNDFFSSQSNALPQSDKKSQPEGPSNPPQCKPSSPGMSSAPQDPPNKKAKGPDLPQSAAPIVQSAPLVSPSDKNNATAFSYYLLSQMQQCVFTEADRLGKRKGLPAGFAGLACRHCFGGYGSGRFFPSSIKTLSDTSKTLNVLHNHMQRCRKCPTEVRTTLEKLRANHDEERAKMKFGSQKAFFAKIWARLHGGPAPSPSGKLSQVSTGPMSTVGRTGPGVPYKMLASLGGVQQGTSKSMAGPSLQQHAAAAAGMKRKAMPYSSGMPAGATPNGPPSQQGVMGGGSGHLGDQQPKRMRPV